VPRFIKQYKIGIGCTAGKVTTIIRGGLALLPYILGRNGFACIGWQIIPCDPIRQARRLQSAADASPAVWDHADAAEPLETEMSTVRETVDYIGDLTLIFSSSGDTFSVKVGAVHQVSKAHIKPRNRTELN